jgi:uncharacterized protein (TIGR02246 family)
MSAVESFLSAARTRHQISADALHGGDPQPFLDVWSERQSTSLFPPEARVGRGPEAIEATVRSVAARMSGGTPLALDIVNATVSGDLAFFCGWERCQVATHGGDLEPSLLRVTQVYRREDGKWRLLHRHASHGPAGAD